MNAHMPGLHICVCTLPTSTLYFNRVHTLKGDTKLSVPQMNDRTAGSCSKQKETSLQKPGREAFQQWGQNPPDWRVHPEAGNDKLWLEREVRDHSQEALNTVLKISLEDDRLLKEFRPENNAIKK